MQRGYIKLWRKIEDSGLLGNADVCQMFMYLLVKATHKPRKVMVGSRVVELQVGQFFTGRKQLACELNSTEQRVRTVLSTLEKMQIINQQATRVGTVITITNWVTYQTDQPTPNQHINQQPTNEQPTPNQHIYIKQECKNERIRKEKNTQKEKPLKRPYGEFQNVMLTDDEFSKLVEKHGKPFVLSLTEEMSAGIEAKGYKYKSHYAAFRTWAERRGKEEASVPRGQPTVRATTVAQQRAMERDQFARELLGETDNDGDENFAIPEGLQFGLPTSSAVRGGTQDFGRCLGKRPLGLQ